MLRRLDQAWQPTHWGVVFDGGLPAERLALQPAYKAQRPPMPDDLKSQLPLINRYLDLLRVPRLLQVGEEADDVMASLVRQAKDVFDETLMATGDKDMFQLVDNRIRVVPVSGAEPQIWGPDEIMAKTGVAPDQIVDWLALTGDSADNIPGVPGVGPKTAARLLQQYGSLAVLFERLDELPPGKIRDGLTASRDQVQGNVAMVRLRNQIAPDVDWQTWRRNDPDSDALAQFFDEVEFKGLAAECRQPSLF